MLRKTYFWCIYCCWIEVEHGTGFFVHGPPTMTFQDKLYLDRSLAVSFQGSSILIMNKKKSINQPTTMSSYTVFLLNKLSLIEKHFLCIFYQKRSILCTGSSRGVTRGLDLLVFAPPSRPTPNWLVQRLKMAYSKGLQPFLCKMPSGYCPLCHPPPQKKPGETSYIIQPLAQLST